MTSILTLVLFGSLILGLTQPTLQEGREVTYVYIS